MGYNKLRNVEPGETLYGLIIPSKPQYPIERHQSLQGYGGSAIEHIMSDVSQGEHHSAASVYDMEGNECDLFNIVLKTATNRGLLTILRS